jgi:3-methylcrotonyl-CoA carboxylase alpha subunit
MGRIKKILIANRGEIAVRIMHTAQKMGISTVAVYAEADRNSPHVLEADEARCLGEIELSETYLNIGKIITVAKETACDAIHPGYGFLAENPLFVEACDVAGIIFIGPRAEVMRVMGDKIAARAFVRRIGVPITEGLSGNRETLLKTGSTIGYPVLLKAAAGGGGKGIQIVYHEKDLEDALQATSRQAMAYFGDDTIYLEKYLENPRHIEFQIFGDNQGNVIHLFERECSIQRRFQKIIEESPSPTLTSELREKMGAAAIRIGKEIRYTNAGTIEFLVDPELKFYFLEMNTRIQVEHPVTEMVTGTDLVEEQIRVAEGMPLSWKQENLHQTGHAIECRIYAEDPEHNFIPSPGKMTLYKEPVMDHIRIDKGITGTSEIKSAYDPMICKLVSWGNDREEARSRMIDALHQYAIHGIKTNIPYLSALLTHPAFISNSISTKFCDEHTTDLITQIHYNRDQEPVEIPLIGFLLMSLGIRENKERLNGRPAGVWDSTGFWREQKIIRIRSGAREFPIKVISSHKNDLTLLIDGKFYPVKLISENNAELKFNLNDSLYLIRHSMNGSGTGFVSYNGHVFEMQRLDFLPSTVTPVRFESSHHNNEVYSPMPGKVIRLLVKEGDQIMKGDVLVIVEAMKMENSIVSPINGTIKKIHTALNDRVDPLKALIILDKNDDNENKKVI